MSLADMTNSHAGKNRFRIARFDNKTNKWIATKRSSLTIIIFFYPPSSFTSKKTIGGDPNTKYSGDLNSEHLNNGNI